VRSAAAGSVEADIQEVRRRFESNNDQLWSVGCASCSNWYYGLMAGTSPAITMLPGGSYQIAFTANTGDLWSGGGWGGGDFWRHMTPGTSPSIAITSCGYQIAFQRSNNFAAADGCAGG
jgi:hypothetical protein